MASCRKAPQAERLVEEVRDSALQLRMVQIGATFNRFQRVVRDVSRELGKDIALEIAAPRPNWTRPWSRRSATR
jgi:two-component system chemotaxis sensor kinase CheA